jgi:hypothetical protein
MLNALGVRGDTDYYKPKASAARFTRTKEDALVLQHKAICSNSVDSYIAAQPVREIIAFQAKHAPLVLDRSLFWRHAICPYSEARS